MLIAFFRSGRHAPCKDLLGFAGAGFAGEQLAVHQVGGDVVRIALQERAKMLIGGAGVAAVHALHGQAVAREGVIGLLGDELFQRLATGFLLFRHRVVSYYTGSTGGIQNRAGARGFDEAEKRK